MAAVQIEHAVTDVDQLRRLATRTINEHVDDHGLCAACGSSWPCEFAVLADHNLAFASGP
ncbi:MAG TPA: hypothetical protein VFX16_03155 [Pseudonocardiaceae bacterium]|nr:hypothetical protein [Pseudonocardiaceae bacterium]